MAIARAVNIIASHAAAERRNHRIGSREAAVFLKKKAAVGGYNTRGSSRRVKSYPTYDPRPGVMVGSLEGHPRGSDLAGNGLMVIIPPPWW